MAAVLAYGEDATLSHRSAAELWALLPHRHGPIDVTVPGTGGRRKRQGIRLHRSSLLTSAVTTIRDGIAVTTPSRTLADLGRCATPGEVRRAIRQAEVLGLPIGDRGGAVDLTRSELERRFLRLCQGRRLPTPEVNARVGSFVVDFLWRDQRLIVETDGYRFHRGRWAFEADRARDIELKLRGYEVVRFTHRQVVHEAAGVAHTLRVLLA
jgi:very-short-patch-repair endonuclease